VFLTDERVSGKKQPLIKAGDFWGENAQFYTSEVKRQCQHFCFIITSMIKKRDSYIKYDSYFQKIM